jgi:hypothetical protein
MPAVLTTSSQVLCALVGAPPSPPIPLHGGTVNTTGLPKLTVNGSPVLAASGISIHAVALCKTVTNAMIGNKQCTSVTTVAPTSLATKLLVSGQPVALETLSGTTDGTVAGVFQALTASANQTKLMTI